MCGEARSHARGVYTRKCYKFQTTSFKKVKVIVEFYLSSTQELLSIYMSVKNVSFILQNQNVGVFGRVQAEMFAQHVAKLICVVND